MVLKTFTSFLPMLALIFLWLAGLGDRPLATPDEARYVEIPREMVVSGDWLTPRLDGVQYFEKPPLLYWIYAIVQSVGVTPDHEGWMRLPIVLLGLLGLVATWVFTRHYANKPTAQRAIWMLGTCVLYYTMGRLIILDMALTVWITIAFYAFYAALDEEINFSRRRLWMWCAAATIALSVLTKGIVALALLGPFWASWLTYTQSWGRLHSIFSSLVIFSAIVMPWHVMCGLHNPDFYHKYFVVEHWLRYTTTIHARYQPVWYFIPIVFAGFLPWSTLVPRIPKNPLTIYLASWALWVFAFYSFSNSKLIPYILPVMVPLAILYAMGASVKKHQAWVWAVLSLVLIAAPLFFPELYVEKVGLLYWLYVLAALFLIMAFGVWFWPKWQTMALCQIGILIAMNYGACELQKPSIKSLASFLIEAQKKHGGKIASFKTYLQDLPVYTNQIVTVVSALGELEYGAQAEDTSAWIMTTEQWFQKSHEHYWLTGRVGDIKHIPPQYRVVKQTSHFFVATNKADAP